MKIPRASIIVVIIIITIIFVRDIVSDWRSMCMLYCRLVGVTPIAQLLAIIGNARCSRQRITIVRYIDAIIQRRQYCKGSDIPTTEVQRAYAEHAMPQIIKWGDQLQTTPWNRTWTEVNMLNDFANSHFNLTTKLLHRNARSHLTPWGKGTAFPRLKKVREWRSQAFPPDQSPGDRRIYWRAELHLHYIWHNGRRVRECWVRDWPTSVYL